MGIHINRRVLFKFNEKPVKERSSIVGKIKEHCQEFLDKGGYSLGYSMRNMPQMDDFNHIRQNKITAEEFNRCCVHKCKLEFIDMPAAMELERYYCGQHDRMWEVPMDVTRHWDDAEKVKKEGEE